MNKIKAFFFDIDGTLYEQRVHDFPKSTKKLLYKLKENGYKIGFATSRCQYETRTLPSFFKEFPFDVQIFDGGALIIENNDIVGDNPLKHEDILRLIEYTKKHNLPFRYSTIDDDYVAHNYTSNVFDVFFYLYLNMPSIKKYENENVYNVLIYINEESHIQEIKKLVPETKIIVHGKHTLEITASGIEKGASIEYICNRWGISIKDVVCFGDGANDVAMLQMAGIGVAMGNACLSAKNASDYVCESIENDGIYQFCKEQNFIE